MKRGTTPDYILEVAADLSDMTVFVAIYQGVKGLVKTGDDLSIAVEGGESTIAFQLTQEETLFLREGPASIEVTFINASGYTQKTEIKTVTVDRTLLDKVVHYAED